MSNEENIATMQANGNTDTALYDLLVEKHEQNGHRYDHERNIWWCHTCDCDTDDCIIHE